MPEQPLDQSYHLLIRFGLDEFRNGILYRESESGSADTTTNISRSAEFHVGLVLVVSSFTRNTEGNTGT